MSRYGWGSARQFPAKGQCTASKQESSLKGTQACRRRSEPREEPYRSTSWPRCLNECTVSAVADAHGADEGAVPPGDALRLPEYSAVRVGLLYCHMITLDWDHCVTNVGGFAYPLTGTANCSSRRWWHMYSKVRGLAGSSLAGLSV